MVKFKKELGIYMTQYYYLTSKSLLENDGEKFPRLYIRLLKFEF